MSNTPLSFYHTKLSEKYEFINQNNIKKGNFTWKIPTNQLLTTALVKIKGNPSAEDKLLLLLELIGISSPRPQLGSGLELQQNFWSIHENITK